MISIWMDDDGREEMMSEETLERLKEAAERCLCMEGFDGETDRIALSLTLAGEEEIRELNREYRGVDRVTDVLSFPMFDGEEDIREALGVNADGEAEIPEARIPGDEAVCGGPETEIPLGDVVLCREKIRQQAAEYGHSEERELVYLFVHSLLHLLGFDHMDEAEKKVMREKEEAVMTAMELVRQA